MPKKHLTFILGFTLIINVFSQETIIDFDSPIPEGFRIDTNNWEVGVPNYLTFDSSYSGDHAIVTGLNGSPQNEHIFSLTLLNNVPHDFYSISFKYKLNAAPGATAHIFVYAKDGFFGSSEFFALSSEDIYDSYTNRATSTALNLVDDATRDWQDFIMYYPCLAVRPNAHKSSTGPDTLLTFKLILNTPNATGQITEGWMIDDIRIEDYPFICSGIKGLDKTNAFNIYPNPASKSISIDINNLLNGIIYDQSGREVLQFQHPNIDISILSSGSYYILLNTDEGIKSAMLQVH